MVQHLTHFDYSKVSDEIFVDLIYYTNGIKLPLDKLTIESPKVITVGEDLYKRNTSILVKGKGEGRRDLRGERLLFYNRVDLSRLESSYPPINIRKSTTSTYEILNEINLSYGLNLSEDDVLDIKYIYGQPPYFLVSNTNSLTWVGKMKLNLILSPPLLQNRELIGFYDKSTRLVHRRKLLGFNKYRRELIRKRYLSGFY